MEVPFALSIHKFVNSIGADAGFAAFICVAVIGLLYFAQARETATLRDRLEDAHERIGGLEARIAQLMHLQSTRQPVPQTPGRAPQPGRVTPPPAAARPMGSAIASVRRIPSATATAVGAAPGDAPPFAPVGMGAPALASATKLIPDPVLAPAAAEGPDDTMLVPGGAVTAAGNGKTETPAPAAAVAPRAPAGPTPPRVQIRPDAPAPRRTVSAPARPLNEARFDVFEQDRSGSRSRFGNRRMPLAIGILAVVVIIGGLVAITQSGGGTNSSTVHTTTTPAKSSTGSHKGKKHKAAPFSASNVTVAVLNGTAVQGLAADVAKVLAGAGYKKGSVTNAASQTQSSTIVYFMPHYKADALQVAKQLKLKPASVQAATQTAIQACGTTPAGTATSCSGEVIVSAGQDKASLANSASTSAG
jgi:hypothetical protein